MHKRSQVSVHGLVQGVGFRAATKQMADQIGVSGWVKNQSDGTVLIEVEGDPDKIRYFIDKVEQGPTPFSKVEHLDVSEKDDLQGHPTFKVIH